MTPTDTIVEKKLLKSLDLRLGQMGPALLDVKITDELFARMLLVFTRGKNARWSKRGD